jgi:hypothetical protein
MTFPNSRGIFLGQKIDNGNPGFNVFNHKTVKQKWGDFYSWKAGGGYCLRYCQENAILRGRYQADTLSGIFS